MSPLLLTPFSVDVGVDIDISDDLFIEINNNKNDDAKKTSSVIHRLCRQRREVAMIISSCFFIRVDD